MIVVDASVLTDFLVGRDTALDAVAEAVSADPDQALHAPELVEPETLNALRGLVRNRVISEQRAAEACRDLDAVRLVRHPHTPLRERVWSLRHDLTAYDASYLALAEAFDGPLLLTADAGLATVAERSLGPGGCRLVR